MQSDRASTSAMKLSRGLFGAGKVRPVRPADLEPPEPEDGPQVRSDLKHLFGR